ncbi:MAG: cbb3-type cytochrome oxidase assembly protein CcoS [Cyclobacteriaceae bacterium]|nr:cbb3-type cytochrome oxidase assembly protein CcoS [Cyclobacteriaceae bacterium]
MIIVGFLIGVSLTIALVFLGIFIWSMRSGQYDDTYAPPLRMLFDDKPVEENKAENKADNTR